MRQNLPPLTALRAFEAAARHLSLKRAAEELHVTPAAISHQVQQLEAALDMPLFKRGHRSVALTEAAQRLAHGLHEGFDRIEGAVQAVRAQRSGDVLRIITPPSFASQWLMPRLAGFIGTYAELDVQVSTRIRPFNRVPSGQRGELQCVTEWAEECDAVIALGGGDYPGLQVDRVLALSITPLCSPQLLAQGLKHAQDLRHLPLLHDERGMIYGHRSFWDLWTEAAEVNGIATDTGQHFSHSTLAVQAAIAGRGVVASTVELVQPAMDSGQLVAPFELRVPWDFSYHLVISPSNARRPMVQAFRQWLLQETGAAQG